MKGDFTYGSSTAKDFFAWMIERHNIYERRRRGDPPPWTDDPVLRNYKFCNVFRQLDRGTVVLREMLRDSPLTAWNIIWYRLFNLDQNAKWMETPRDLRVHITKRWAEGEKLFTDAHMTTGRTGEYKHESMLDTAEDAFDLKLDFSSRKMEEVFKQLLPLYGVGSFVAYEIVCDFRFHCFEPTDTMAWANVGPGAKRGMQRLGLDPSLYSMQWLLMRAPKLECNWPFELREIEHSLCEFDKYRRIIEGGGKGMRRFR